MLDLCSKQAGATSYEPKLIRQRLTSAVLQTLESPFSATIRLTSYSVSSRFFPAIGSNFGLFERVSGSGKGYVVPTLYTFDAITRLVRFE